MIETRVKQVVCTTFKITEKSYHEELAAGDIPEWDSLGHVNLLAAVENEFNIAFDVGDAIEVESLADLIQMVHKYTTTSA